MTPPCPAKAPCRSCPYRLDVPSGVWSEEEYAKLPPYDGSTWEQPTAVFYCHQQDGCICAGWAGAHDMAENFAVRLAVLNGTITSDDYDALLDYESSVPLFESGQAAADHGLAKVEAPDVDAIRTIKRLERKLAKKSTMVDTQTATKG